MDQIALLPFDDGATLVAYHRPLVGVPAKKSNLGK